MYCFVVLILLFFFVCWPHTEPTGTESKLQYACLNYAEAFYVVFMSCRMVAGKDSRVSSVQRFKLSEQSWSCEGICEHYIHSVNNRF